MEINHTLLAENGRRVILTGNLERSLYLEQYEKGDSYPHRVGVASREFDELYDYILRNVDSVYNYKSRLKRAGAYSDKAFFALKAPPLVFKCNKEEVEAIIKSFNLWKDNIVEERMAKYGIKCSDALTEGGSE